MLIPSLLAASLLVLTDPPTPIINGDVGRQLDAAMRRAEAHGFSGSVLVARRDTILLRQAYGPANRLTGTALTPGNPLIIGSVSKQFVATAIMALVSDGKLRVTDTLGALLPAVPADKRGITVRQLLTHTAGLQYLLGVETNAADRAALVRALLAAPLASRPGTAWAYSNIGYSLLAAIVERVAGEPYPTYVQRLAARAGVQQLTFLWDRSRLSPADAAVHSYTGTADDGALAEFQSPGFLFGAGDVIATADDLFRWTLAVQRGAILPAAARDELLAPAVPMPQQNMRYAYGWHVIALPNGSILHDHPGDLGGYNAALRFYDADSVTIVMLGTSRLRGMGTRVVIANELSNVLRGRPGLPIPQLSAAPATAQRALSGEFTLARGGRVRVDSAGAGVRLTTEDAEGVAALFGNDSAGAPAAARYSLAADTLLSRFVHDSLAALAARYHPATKGGDLVAALTEIRRELVQQHGALTGARVLGTLVHGPGAASTEAVLQFGTRSIGLSMDWEGDVTWGLTPRATREIATRFAIESDTSAAAFDLMTRRLVRVRTTATGIAIESPAGVVEARRTTG